MRLPEAMRSNSYTCTPYIALRVREVARERKCLMRDAKAGAVKSKVRRARGGDTDAVPIN